MTTTAETYLHKLAEILGDDWRVEAMDTKPGALLTYSVGDAEGCQSAATYSIYATPPKGFYEYSHEEEEQTAEAATLDDLIGEVAAAYVEP